MRLTAGPCSVAISDLRLTALLLEHRKQLVGAPNLFGVYTRSPDRTDDRTASLSLFLLLDVK